MAVEIVLSTTYDIELFGIKKGLLSLKATLSKIL